MELVLQTRKNIWSFTFRQGFRRISTWDWKKTKETMESLFKYRHELIGEAVANMTQAEKDFWTPGKTPNPKHACAWKALDDNSLPTSENGVQPLPNPEP